MSGNKTGAEKSFQQIRPVSVVLTQANERHDAAVRAINLPFAALIAVILLICSVFIFLLLPEWFKPDSPPSAASRPLPTASEKPDTESPPSWNEPQLAELRKKSQDTLAAMRQAEEQLNKKAVDQWGAEDYARAVGHAEQGDRQYRNKQFKGANAEYERALTIFNDLLTEADKILRLSLEQGHGYLQSGDAGKAEESFEKALLIEPENAGAAAGLRRARTLDEVRGLTDRGTELLLQGELETAGNMFKQALSLDKDDELGKKRMAEVQQRSRDRDFNHAMSAGYAALDNNDYAPAAKEFGRALQIKPGAQEALSALDQSKQEMITADLRKLLLRGRTLEIEERWKDAIDIYMQALKLDGSSAEAQRKKQAAQRMARLDRKLTDTIDHGERLADQDVYKEALALQNEINGIETPGPRLTGQKKALDELLQQASEPVAITFLSDNKTDVTIYKVGKLGNFEKTSLELLPGRYVAVGNRPGYRDVRVEFVVRARGSPQSVVIRSQEKIVSTSR